MKKYRCNEPIYFPWKIGSKSPDSPKKQERKKKPEIVTKRASLTLIPAPKRVEKT
jgi:hypothetical protein